MEHSILSNTTAGRTSISTTITHTHARACCLDRPNKQNFPEWHQDNGVKLNRRNSHVNLGDAPQLYVENWLHNILLQWSFFAYSVEGLFSFVCAWACVFLCICTHSISVLLCMFLRDLVQHVLQRFFSLVLNREWTLLTFVGLGFTTYFNLHFSCTEHCHVSFGFHRTC